MTGGGGRPFCWSCRRAQTRCLCAEIRRAGGPVDAPWRLWILLHPRERLRTVGSAFLLRELVRDARIIDAGGRPDVETDARLAELRADIRAGRVSLLYPGPSARVLGSEGGTSRHGGALVVVDATWAAAQRMVRQLRWLEELPRVTLPRGAPSAYEFRRQPRQECVSSLEAVARSLRAEGCAAEGERLERVFATMVARQAAESLTAPGREPRPAESPTPKADPGSR